ncbi:helix-turn-helix domain-containing protein [Erwinia rhapontici]|uniref:helix-turn-helix domain-containing protein n=1 Tax=Erwinia rhapontici TaxID=55212 RepID=UPI003D36F9C0
MSKPSPQQVKAARESAGLTQSEAGSRFGYSLRAWQRKEESGDTGRSLSVGEYELLLLISNAHPTMKLVKK